MRGRRAAPDPPLFHRRVGGSPLLRQRRGPPRCAGKTMRPCDRRDAFLPRASDRRATSCGGAAWRTGQDPQRRRRGAERAAPPAPSVRFPSWSSRIDVAIRESRNRRARITATAFRFGSQEATGDPSGRTGRARVRSAGIQQ